jgi:hypothetical protein
MKEEMEKSRETKERREKERRGKKRREHKEFLSFIFALM